jgi:UPF0755 protein
MNSNVEGPHAVEGSIDELRDDGHPLFGTDESSPYVPGARTRAQRRRRHGRRRRHRIAPLLAIVVIAVVVASSWVLVRKVGDRFAVADYSGTGQGFVRIQVQPGDGAADIADTMQKAGVVKSSRAFINAAKASGRAGDIQPGTYRVRLHSSGVAAMDAILDPANRLVSKVTVPEGFTERQILADFAQKTGVPRAELSAAAANLGNLGIPDGFSPTSAEGFLFPATYEINPSMSADTIVQSMVTQFSAENVRIGFDAAAKAERLTPYQALIIASLVESEAKFPEDRPKIARVILNRLAANRPIGIDSVNRYGLALEGKDPNSVTFKEQSPYNVRIHTGLPPTPISNPGEASLQAAVNPAQGDWLFYVVSDAQGHHFFTSSESAFMAAVAQCKANGWGC